MEPSAFFIDGKPPTDAQFNVNRYSGLTAGVPGTPYAWSYILRKYGTWKLSRGAEATASRSHATGFTVDKTFFDQTTPNIAYFDDIPSTAALYLDAGRHAEGRRDRAQEPGHGPHLRAHRPARRDQGLLHRSGGGRDGQGGHAAARDATADHTWRPGLLSDRDLMRYRAKEREAVKLSYFGHDIYGMGPPSSAPPRSPRR